MRKAILIVMLATAAVAAETRVIHVKHRRADTLAHLVRGPDLTTTWSDDFNTITLRGPAEVIKTAEAVVAQYDTPRRQAEFLIRVIEAASGGSVTQGPNDAADLVPAELKSLLRYSRYTQRDSAVLRGMESDRLRIALGGNMNGEMDFRMRETSLLEVKITIFGPSSVIKSKGVEESRTPTLLQTSTTVKDGETVVLGASKMQGGTNALIVLLTAKLLP